MSLQTMFRYSRAVRLAQFSCRRHFCPQHLTAAREEEALGVLSGMLDLSLARAKTAYVKGSHSISATIELQTGGVPEKDQLAYKAEMRLRKLPWVNKDAKVRVKLTTKTPVYSQLLSAHKSEESLTKALEKVPAALHQIGSIVAVSSCKGGVGKSTVAVNLAFSLAKLGARTGLLDADIYGPSLPTLVNLPPGSLPVIREADSKLVRPPQVGGVKLMSYGFVAKGASQGNPEAAVVRGPVVSQVVQQLACGTAWGPLDVLVVDLPPGTGDITLTVSQTLALTAAVVVTTPQQLSYVDVIKGVDMFQKLKVPIAAVVENMSHFDAPSTGERFYPFGRGAMERLLAKKGLENADAYTLPIRSDLSTAMGMPLALATSKGHGDDNRATDVLAVEETFERLAERLSVRLSQEAYSQRQLPPRAAEETSSLERQDGTLDVGHRLQVTHDDGTASVASLRYDPRRRSVVLRFLQGAREGTEHALAPEELRLAGRDALTTSDPKLSPETLPLDLHPVQMELVGNYAVSIVWSDGHSEGIYSFDQIVALSEARLIRPESA